jgi:hypothetical protein
MGAVEGLTKPFWRMIESKNRRNENLISYATPQQA